MDDRITRHLSVHLSMQSRDDLLNILADGEYHSGVELGRQLKISRAAVWKRLRHLQDCGLALQTRKGKGYRIPHILELLNRDSIQHHLQPQMRRKINRLTLHNVIASTNQHLLDQLPNSLHRHITLAEYQTAGRGRRGRHWHSPYAAGICLSIGWQFDPVPDPAALLSLGAGVAVMRALEQIGISGAGLKWPNDVLWRARKLGGILVEMRMESAGPCHAVIGVGLNYSFPPDQKSMPEVMDYPWIDIAGIRDNPPSRNHLAALLITQLVNVLEEIQDNHGSSIIETWKKYDCFNGRQAELLLPQKKIRGRVLGIDPQGALLMSVNGKTERFNSGEISLRSTS